MSSTMKPILVAFNDRYAIRPIKSIWHSRTLSDLFFQYTSQIIMQMKNRKNVKFPHGIRLHCLSTKNRFALGQQFLVFTFRN